MKKNIERAIVEDVAGKEDHEDDIWSTKDGYIEPNNYAESQETYDYLNRRDNFAVKLKGITIQAF